MNETFENWLFNHFIQYEPTETINQYYIPDLGVVQLIDQDPSLTSVEGELNLNMTYLECEELLRSNIEYFAFQFGDEFYYTPTSKICDIQLTELKHVGQYDGYLPKDEDKRVFAGLHGRYESMNGTRDYSDWCRKAKFLKINTLGICEKNSLAGTLPFQMACDKAKVTPIIGYTADVETNTGKRYDIKLYCVNHLGWTKLLRINTIINIEQDGFIKQDELLKHLDGLVAVISPGEHVDRSMLMYYTRYAEKAFFQITTNEYKSDEKDESLLVSMKRYVEDWQDILDPILIDDAYCLDEMEVHLRDILNKQGGVKFSYSTENHHFKSFEELSIGLEELFDSEDDRFAQLFNNSIRGLKQLKKLCQFQINTKELFLPKYELTDEELEEYGTSDKMFDELIRKGIYNRYHKELSGPYGDQFSLELEERIEKEKDVIIRGGFIDYFLILFDIVNWCKTKNIQVGPGRGSAAGCVISYLLGIVKIDPLRFDLLFERFLNESRIKSELPDIDLDFASDRRDEVIEYMRDRYGRDYVCRVGTYGTLQMRGVIKELARAYNFEGEYNLNFLSTLIEENGEWEPIFKSSLENRALKHFIEDNPRIIGDSKGVLNAIKSSSMHACATIIVPKINDAQGNPLTIYEQIPVREEDGMLISEWEGEQMAEAGFLKEDILSTKQMAKIGAIFDLVKDHYGVELDMEEIPLDDDGVYELFQQGKNQDVFHFGSSGLTSYLKMVKPTSIDELIASIALYRPGAMSSNAHMDYVKLKKGEIQPEYDYNLKIVTEDTYGLYIYQEQIMKAVQVLGDFTLTEADGVRKAMGKKIKSKMDGYKVQFVENAVKKGCDKDEALKIWNKMEVFAGYGFNKSHAAAYSVIGYYCNWLKLHYPLEFWTVAFQYAKEEKIKDFVSEINTSGDIEIVAPDINKSNFEFRSDRKNNRIYWNLSSIKYVGEVAAKTILDERDKDGKYYSMEEFFERTSGKGVNKRTIEHLILSGCFDEMYNVKKPSDRLTPMKEYYALRPKETVPQKYLDNVGVDHFWSILQNEISQLSNLDYHKLLRQSQFAPYQSTFISVEEMNQMKVDERNGPTHVVAGMIQEIVVRKTKKDQREYAVIKVVQDDVSADIRVWPQQLENESNDRRLFSLQQLVREQKASLVVMRGNIQFNSYTNANELVVSDRINGPICEIF